MTRLHKEEFEKTNSQNVEQRHENEFFTCFKKHVSMNLYDYYYITLAYHIFTLLF